ncbi:MAG: FAD-binding protein [Gammaproteobacteria bacterium]
MREIAPRDEAEVAAAIAASLAAGSALAIQGRGTRSGYGGTVAAPARLSLARMSGIVRYEPTELVMTALPGTPLAQVHAELARARQHLAFEPPGGGVWCDDAVGQGSIGGAFLANLAGPRRLSAGAARDHLLGFRAVNGRGERFKAGGAVIKNVTGYDLCKLIAGSLGTLSVVTELTFKTLPAPQVQVTAAFAGAAPGDAFALMRALAAGPAEPGALAMLPAGALPGETVGDDARAPVVLARLEGSQVSVRARFDAIARGAAAGTHCLCIEDGRSAAIWAAVRDVAPVMQAQDVPVMLRVAMPPARARELYERHVAGRGIHWCFDAGGAWAWLAPPEAQAGAVVSSLRQWLDGAGAVVIVRGPPEFKARAGVFSTLPAAHARLIERIRAAFDPAGILNPGRMPITGASS